MLVFLDHTWSIGYQDESKMMLETTIEKALVGCWAVLIFV